MISSGMKKLRNGVPAAAAPRWLISSPRRSSSARSSIGSRNDMTSVVPGASRAISRSADWQQGRYR